MGEGSRRVPRINSVGPSNAQRTEQRVEDRAARGGKGGWGKRGGNTRGGIKSHEKDFAVKGVRCASYVRQMCVRHVSHLIDLLFCREFSDRRDRRIHRHRGRGVRCGSPRYARRWMSGTTYDNCADKYRLW